MLSDSSFVNGNVTLAKPNMIQMPNRSQVQKG